MYFLALFNIDFNANNIIKLDKTPEEPQGATVLTLKKPTEDEDDKIDTEEEEDEVNKEYQNLNKLRMFHIANFENFGYAKLKGKNFTKLIKKFVIILGRTITQNNQNEEEAVKKPKWWVDIELGTSKKISRQHAVILYNFQN